MPGELRGQFLIVVGPVVLRDQHLSLGAIPSTRPVLVRPHEAEWDIDTAIIQEASEWLL